MSVSIKREFIDYSGVSVDGLRKIIGENNGVLPILPSFTEDEVRSLIEQHTDTGELAREFLEIIHLNYPVPVKPGKLNAILGIANVNLWNYPNMLKLLGILREWSFTAIGGGVNDIDIDEFDQHMDQLILINPQARISDPIQYIVGGYRDLVHRKAASYEKGAMKKYFILTELLTEQVWMELGRSFFSPWYVIHGKALGVTSDAIRYGLGYLYSNNRDVVGFVGKVTVYETYKSINNADQLLYGMARTFWRAGQAKLAMPKSEYEVREMFLSHQDERDIANHPFRMLMVKWRKNYNLPMLPVVAWYASMADMRQMHYLGTVENPQFNSREVGLGIQLEDIKPSTLETYVEPFLTNGGS